MGGRLAVESRPGIGSRFDFSGRFQRSSVNDVAESHSGIRQLATAISDASTRCSVLVAEDNAVNRQLAVRLLSKRGYTVVLAQNGVEAVAEFERGECDVILMDVQMPEMDGLLAAATIREREKLIGGHIPIIAMTANAMKGDREKCLAAGMDDYISKPFRAEELFEKMAYYTRDAQHSNERQLAELL